MPDPSNSRPNPSSIETKRANDQFSGSSIERCIGYFVLAAGFALILATTLWPFDFHFKPLSWAEYFASFDTLPSSRRDLLSNILLFIPFGFGICFLMHKVGVPKRLNLVFTVLMGFILSASIESLQIFLAPRNSNIPDVISNTLGAFAGFYVCLRHEGLQDIARLFRLIIQPAIGAALLFGFLLFNLVIGLILMSWMDPSGWDPNYRFAIGNEMTGDRLWQGQLKNIVILDRAVSSKEVDALLAGSTPASTADALIAEFRLDQEYGLSDYTKKCPDLVPQIASDPQIGISGVALQNGMWLATDTPATVFAERINPSGSFALALTLATQDLEQYGTRRILTISEDPWHRNFTLGQNGRDLVLRCRTILLGDNGARPEIHIPNVFTSLESQRLVINYNGPVIRVHTTGEASSREIVLTPELGLSTLFRKRTTSWPIQVGRSGIWHFSLFYLFLTFVPLGMLLEVAVGESNKRLFQKVLILFGILSPALILETVFTVFRGGEIRPAMVILCAALTALGFFFMRLWGRKLITMVVAFAKKEALG